MADKKKLVAIAIAVILLSFCVGYWLAVVNKPMPSREERDQWLADEMRRALEDAGIDLGLSEGEACVADADAGDPTGACRLGLECREGVCNVPEGDPVSP